MTEREIMLNLEKVDQEYKIAEQNHDMDGMLQALKEFQAWREKLEELHTI